MTDLKQDLASLRIPQSAALRSSRSRRWPVAVVVLALIAAGIVWQSTGRAIEVSTITPTVHSGTDLMAGTPVLTASGYVVARRRAVVSAKIQGRLAELHVEEGARVTEGQLFARLESADFEAAVSRARAQLQQAEAQISGARAQIGSADAALNRAAADRAEASRQLQVAERLSKEDILPADQLDAARSRVVVAEAAVDQMRAEQQRARADLERAAAERARAQADVGSN